MKYASTTIAAFIVVMIVLISCKNKFAGNKEMEDLLSLTDKKEFSPENSFCPQAQIPYYDSMLKRSIDEEQVNPLLYAKGNAYLQLGEEDNAVKTFEKLLKNLDPADSSHIKIALRDMALSYLRQGERSNCVHGHGAESCIFPIQGTGIHMDKTGSQKAIEIYKQILAKDPADLESRWLLNIAYMTIGEYPGQVPAALLIPGLDTDSAHDVKPFVDIAMTVGLNKKDQAGGCIIEDFDNDGDLDMVTTSWNLSEHMTYYTNNGNGVFVDESDSSGLKGLTGGLNMMQTDYNNDGFKDIFVLRGAWKGKYGKEPNSLLRNNGDGTFTDVTKESGLLSFHPTQTATWNDFNNDGWLDVFIGNESNLSNNDNDENPCELYINNKNGTFTNIAAESGTNVIAFVKGVTSGDYDNDGRPDIFLSTLGGKKYLFKNQGVKNGTVHFSNVTEQAGLGNFLTRTFPTWFWDYDNDGWLDILVCGYEFSKSLAGYAAGEALKMDIGNSGKQFLFRNNHDGTFKDVSVESGLNKIAFAMGSNFGDINNDGYPDIYLGTGNPQYQSLVPNKMFRNEGGKYFTDITSSARVGNLQKGHAVSFFDLDNDGDEDVYIEMGGAYVGDSYENSLYLNPGQNNNRWINLNLEGKICNRAAIGAKIKVTFTENSVKRSVYHVVNSGGSFGSNPLVQHIGIGQAASVESVEIKWPVSNKVQVFKNIRAGDYIMIKEGDNVFTKRTLKKLDFTARRAGIIDCPPVK